MRHTGDVGALVRLVPYSTSRASQNSASSNSPNTRLSLQMTYISWPRTTMVVIEGYEAINPKRRTWQCSVVRQRRSLEEKHESSSLLCITNGSSRTVAWQAGAR
ncbi:hypothetical protein HPB50_003575 [Hyalomma asiaticum]|uniref:Uncharacterized protein n=1 Tax=Hyalomma asiaticum TaxID=266040 RepID=A0ACB7SSU9_HYAAI|nr:hypothetical protein HPB50_003575 [Hyalomma asiaticum]